MNRNQIRQNERLSAIKEKQGALVVGQVRMIPNGGPNSGFTEELYQFSLPYIDRSKGKHKYKRAHRPEGVLLQRVQAKGKYGIVTAPIRNLVVA